MIEHRLVTDEQTDGWAHTGYTALAQRRRAVKNNPRCSLLLKCTSNVCESWLTVKTELYKYVFLCKSVLRTSIYCGTLTHIEASSCYVSATVNAMSALSAQPSRNTAWWLPTGDSFWSQHKMTLSNMTSLWRHLWRHLAFISWTSRACSLTSLWMKRHRLSWYYEFM